MVWTVQDRAGTMVSYHMVWYDSYHVVAHFHHVLSWCHVSSTVVIVMMYIPSVVVTISIVVGI